LALRRSQRSGRSYYGGSPVIVKQNVQCNFDFKRATALVDAALKLPKVE